MVPPNHADDRNDEDDGDLSDAEADRRSDGSPDPADRFGTALPERVEAAERRLRRAGEPFVRATVVRREPPISATVGSRAVVTGEGELVGWIGGVECARSTVVEEATAALEAGEPKLIGLAPEPAAIDRPGMETFRLTCHSGGTVEIFLEPVSPGPELLVVGGSPIGATLAELAPSVGFEVTVVDPDADEGAYPTAGRVLSDADPAAIREAVGDGAYVVVASVGEFDARGVAGGLALSPAYLGLVASEARAREVAEVAADLLGVDPGTVGDAVTSPTGIHVGAETPEEIAVSILAELVEARRRGPPGGRALADALAELDGAASAVPAGADHGRGEGAHRHDEGAHGPHGDGAATADADDGGAGSVATDPVCHMEVRTADPAATVEHGGETYYFCSQGCADAFEERPEEYLQAT